MGYGISIELLVGVWDEEVEKVEDRRLQPWLAAAYHPGDVISMLNCTS